MGSGTEQLSPRRRRAALAVGVASVGLAVTSLVLVLTGGPLAVAAGGGAVLLSGTIDRIDRDGGRAPNTFLIVVGVLAVAVVAWVVRS
ncbi:hypothetical protein ACRQ4C_16715 [Curtobacterium sp. SP.BCp]|uniref:hypothetical protein n=1 Tax=Curtobacterium sp. SP.BCp TaxID=3435230 RepID=UPI003F7314DB